MALNPKANEEKMNKMLNAWRTLALEKTFGGMTLAQFEALVNDAMEARVTVSSLDDSRTQAIAIRDNTDNTFLQKAQLVVNGVFADPTEGDDSAIYEAMGYVRKSNRSSGLTRKKKEAVKK
jgi:hypothetical protein